MKRQWNNKKKLGRLEINKIEIKEENVTGKGNCKFGGIHLQRNVVDREMIKESKQKPNGN